MTNREAVIAAIQVAGYSDSSIDKILIDNGIIGSDVYDASLKASIDLVAIDVLKGMLTVSSVSEGGYSISYSTEGIKERLGYLEIITGIATGPTVRGISVW